MDQQPEPQPEHTRRQQHLRPAVDTGVGSGTRYHYPVSDYRLPGVPHDVASVRLNYQFNSGLGFSLGTEATSPIPLVYNNKLKTPAQYQLDAGVFYVQKNYEVRLDVFNFTGQKNWVYQRHLVYPELPLHVQGTVRVKF